MLVPTSAVHILKRNYTEKISVALRKNDTQNSEAFHISLIGGGWMICHFSIIQVHFVFC